MSATTFLEENQLKTCDINHMIYSPFFMSKAQLVLNYTKNISVAFSDFVFYLADVKSGDPDVIKKTTLRFSQIDHFSPYSFLKVVPVSLFSSQTTP